MEEDVLPQFNDDFCYSLRRVASLLISSGKTGYMLSERNFTKPDSEWVIKGSLILLR